jgi:CheY-like chemotaxis protein
VDNDPVLRSLVARFLGFSGYHVLEAPEGLEALAVTKVHRGRIDLLLTDVVMPEMNGFELAEALTRLHPECKVLYMSGHVVDFPDVREVYEADPSTFMVKPFWAEALIEKVRAVVGDPGPREE